MKNKLRNIIMNYATRTDKDYQLSDLIYLLKYKGISDTRIIKLAYDHFNIPIDIATSTIFNLADTYVPPSNVTIQ